MIAAPFIRPPHALHAAGKGTARRNDRRIRLHKAVQHSQSGSLCDAPFCQFHKFRYRTRIPCVNQRFKGFTGICNLSQTLKLRIPGFLRRFYFPSVGGYIPASAQLFRQSLQCRFRIPHRLYGIHLISVEPAVINRQEPDILPAEQTLGAGREIRQPGTDRQNHIGILCNHIGSESPRHANSSQTVRMAGSAGALPRLCLSEGDFKLFAEALHRFSCLGIFYSASHNNKRFLCPG